jgi:elongation factor 3
MTLTEVPAFCERIAKAVTSKKSTDEIKIAALEELQALIESDKFATAEPLVVSMLLPQLLAGYDAKASDAKKLFKKTLNALIDNVNKYAVALTVTALFTGMTEECKWKVKQGSCQLLGRLAKKGKKKLGHCIPEIVRVVPGLVLDMKKEVGDAARECLNQCIEVIDNRDIKPALAPLISALANPEEVPECIHTLASIKFVQTVDGATLGVVAPLLLRGFSAPKTATKRQCSVIINNMSKLVEDPTDAAPFLPTLLPALERASEEISDPEARAVADKARQQLLKIESNLKMHYEKHPDTPDDLKKLLAEHAGAKGKEATAAPYVEYAAYAAAALNHGRNYKPEVWATNVASVMAPGIGQQAADKACAVALKDMEKPIMYIEGEEDDDGAEELCTCRFSLAYGTKILLHNADLRLKKGRRYGLLGPNDCGKTSLMRAMAHRELDGFPTNLRTVFVEADILGELSHLSCIEYIYADPAIKDCGVDRDGIARMLSTVGFSTQMLTDEVTTLSGGWRMKLALARAMLQKAEVLLMDEPTNHLDVMNVAWVKEYLNNLKDVSVIAVSHDSGLLEDCMTDIIQFNGLKINQYHGKLSTFTETHPETKSFFNLRDSKVTFRFPNPSFLDGVKSKGKALIKMINCSMQYPGKDAPTVTGVTVQVSLGSRVACIGRNGAGKSTVIKMLTGEMPPTSGSVWSFPGIKMAYVAQHAFHHIEQHLEKTPNEYIRWRYEFGEDKEAIEKSTVKLSEEEIEHMKKPVPWEYEDDKGNLKREKRVIKELTGARRDNRKTNIHEYELAWESGAKIWVGGDVLEEWGWNKQLKQIDTKVEAREGLYRRALTQDNVEQHLEDVRLDREFGTHMRIGALSGGQKVKVVLGAATWNQPHLLILDEPTNYLDRESLGGLVKAIEEYEGGVVIISHNDEFCSTLCPETWLVDDGVLNCKGDAEWMKKRAKESVDMVQLDEVVDALGNKSKVKQAKKVLSRKEQKKRDKIRKAKIDNGEPVSDEEDA